MKEWVFLVIAWGVIAVVAVIYSKHKNLVARRIEGVYASVEAARAVLRFNGYNPQTWPGSEEVWHDKNFRNELLVVEKPDGTASVSKYE